MQTSATFPEKTLIHTMNPKDRVGVTKPNLSIIPLAPLYELIAGFTEGARKYGPWNWRKEKVSETIYVDAAIRHLNQWISGETIDPDSGLSHITKAIAGLIILRDAQIHDCSIDDRGPEQKIDIKGVMEKLAAVAEKYPNPVDVAEQPSEGRCTLAAGGSYVMTKSDVGKAVKLRDGTHGTICSVSNDRSDPYRVELLLDGTRKDGHGNYDICVGVKGHYNGDYILEAVQHCPEDVVVVYS